ncbi:MAG: ComEA family DNA-binding protein [Atopobiaceae bacterium]|nr:ComEA family DNA-binding protein [Atopobiaceae bacterium]
MAQESVRRVARRYGAGARVAVLAALACLLVGLALAGMALAGAGRGVTIERAGEDEVPAAEDGAPGEGDAEADAGEVAEASTVVVHVDGAVASAGVYELSEGARVADAVESAGGLLEGADTTSLNLAAPLSDGEKVHVPVVGEDVEETGTGTGGAGPSVVDINTAGVEELDALPGVGEATARAIVEERETNGPFSTPEDLMRVSGIGEKKFAKLEGLIRV